MVKRMPNRRSKDKSRVEHFRVGTISFTEPLVVRDLVLKGDLEYFYSREIMQLTIKVVDRG